jgi:hypothetical protein
VCPNGFFWHPVMDHCMETSTVVCPAGYQWSTSLLSCTTTSSGGTITTPPPDETPSCPADTYWHPVMNHCMSNVCPPGFQYDYTYVTCLQVAGPPPTGTLTVTPIPTTGTPVPTTPAPTGTPPPSCPDGYFWHPGMGHCMSNTCPPGLVFDAVTLYCALPGSDTPVPTSTATPTPTGTPPPSCPDGYFWHPGMGHCMSYDCPPGLVFDPVTLYCVLPGETPEPTATPAATPTPTPLPSCPDGYFWHPDMGHCMSNTCPPGLIFDPGTLYCVLPDP